MLAGHREENATLGEPGVRSAASEDVDTLTLDKLTWRRGLAHHPQSALRHGLGEEEILHAYRNPIRIWIWGTGSP